MEYNIENRLILVHDSKCYPSIEEIKNKVASYKNADSFRPAVYAEPMVFKYGEETDPNIVLVIGAVGDGTVNNSSADKYFFIDFKAVECAIEEVKEKLGDDSATINALEEIVDNLKKACGTDEDGKYQASTNDLLKDVTSLVEADEALASAIQSQYLYVEDTDTIKWEEIERTENGTTLKSHVRIPLKAFIKEDDIQMKENQIIIVKNNDGEKTGIFNNVELEYEDKTNEVVFYVNGDEKSRFSVKGKYIIGGEYDVDSESLVFHYNDNTDMEPINLRELIEEWGVLDKALQKKNGVILTREKDAITNHEHHLQDALVAKIWLSKDEHNLLEIGGNRNGLYASNQAKDIYLNGGESVQDAIDDIVEASISEEKDNIIYKASDGGLFANVDLSYNPANNKLTFTTTNHKGERERVKDLQLNSVELFKEIYYDKATEELVLVYVSDASDGKEIKVRIPVSDLFDEYIAENGAEHTATVTIERNKTNDKTTISVDVNIAKDGHLGISNNILKEDQGELYVDGVASNIMYKNTTVEDALTTNASEISRVEEELTETIETEVSRATAKEIELETKIDNEKQRAEGKETELEGTITNIIDAVGLDENGNYVGYSNLEAQEGGVAYLSGTTVSEDILALAKTVYNHITAGDENFDELRTALNDEIDRATEKENKIEATVNGNSETIANLCKTLGASSDGKPNWENASHDNRVYTEGNDARKDIHSLDMQMDAVSTQVENHSERITAVETVAEANKQNVASNTSKLNTLIGELGAEDDGTIKAYDPDEVTYLKNTTSVRADLIALDNAIKGNADEIDSLSKKLEGEVARATAKEKSIEDSLNSLTNQNTGLETKIDNEISRATSEEEKLKGEIEKETKRASDAEDELKRQIDAEATRATSEEAKLKDEIEKETTRATEKEAELENKIGSLSSNSVVTIEKVESNKPENIAVRYFVKQGGDALNENIGDSYVTYIDIPKDRYLQNVEAVGDDTIRFTFVDENGQVGEPIDINFSKLILEAEVKDGLEVNDGVVKVLLSDDEESKKYLKFQNLSDDKRAIMVSGIDEAINSSITALDATIKANLTEEDTIDTDAHIGIKVVEVDGKLESVTVVENDIASATALANEIVNRKIITGIDGDSYVVHTEASYIQNATSLDAADSILDSALNKVEDKTKNLINTLGATANGEKVAYDNTVTYISSTQTIREDLIELDKAISNLDTEKDAAIESKTVSIEPTGELVPSENVRYSYTLKQGENTIGTIAIPKDQYLQKVQKSDDQTLVFTFIDEKGAAYTESIDFSKMILEAEIGNGLAVTNGVVDVVLSNKNDYLQFASTSTNLHKSIEFNESKLAEAINASMGQESDRAQEVESRLQSAIEAEENRAAQVESELQNAIETEKTRAEQAESELRGALAASTVTVESVTPSEENVAEYIVKQNDSQVGVKIAVPKDKNTVTEIGAFTFDSTSQKLVLNYTIDGEAKTTEVNIQELILNSEVDTTAGLKIDGGRIAIRLATDSETASYLSFNNDSGALQLTGINNAISTAVADVKKELEDKINGSDTSLESITSRLSSVESTTDAHSTDIKSLKEGLASNNEADRELAQAVKDLTTTVTKNKVKSSDGTVRITELVDATELSVSTYRIVSVVSNEATVRAAYTLQNEKGETLGETIKIYKDSNFVDASLNGQTLIIGFLNGEGNRETTSVDLSVFATESEMADAIKIIADRVSVTETSIEKIKSDIIDLQTSVLKAKTTVRHNESNTHITVTSEEGQNGNTTYTVTESNIASLSDFNAYTRETDNTLSGITQQLNTLESNAATKNELSTAIADCKKYTDDKFNELDGTSTNISVLKTRVDTLENNLNEAKTEISSHATSITELQTNLGNAQSDISTLKETTNNLKSDIAAAKTVVKPKNDGHVKVTVETETDGHSVVTVTESDIASASDTATKFTAVDTEVEKIKGDISKNKTECAEERNKLKAELMGSETSNDPRTIIGLKSYVDTQITNNAVTGENAINVSGKKVALVIDSNSSAYLTQSANGLQMTDDFKIKFDKLQSDVEGIPNYIFETTSTIKYAEGATPTTIKPEVKIATDNENLLSVRESGLYVTSTLDYDAVSNTLTFNGQKFQLNAGSVIDGMYYSGGKIYIQYTTAKGESSTVEFDASELFKPLSANGGNGVNVSLTTGSATEGQQLTVSLERDGRTGNMLEITNDGLLVSDDRVTALEGRMTNAESATSDLSHKISIMGETINNIQTNVENNRQKIESLVASVQDLNVKASTTEASLNALASKVDGHDTLFNTVEGRLDNIDIKDAVQDEKIANLEKEVTKTTDNLQNNFDNLKSELTDELKDIKEDIKELQQGGSVADIKEQMNTLNSRLTSLENTMNTVLERLNSLFDDGTY